MTECSRCAIWREEYQKLRIEFMASRCHLEHVLAVMRQTYEMIRNEQATQSLQIARKTRET